MNYFITLLLFLPSFLFAQTPFSQENATDILHHVSVDIGPRTMGSPAEHQAMLYAVEKFKEYGCDTAYIMTMDRSSKVNTQSGIVVGIKKGATDRIILLGGHIDSAEPEVPGANDDGSGSSVTIEAARVLCAQPHHSTLVFCCFGGEEQGLEGSTYFVDHFPDIQKVDLMLQTDMANGLGVIDLLVDSHELYAPRWLVKAAVEEFYKDGYRNLRYASIFMTLNNVFGGGAGSDHEPFLFAGIPAIDFTTDPGDPIHTPRDNFNNFDPRGLKRCGDVVIQLANRFDAGIPKRTTETYFLVLLGKTPIFISSQVIPVAVSIALIIGLLALFSIRSKRELGSKTGKWTFIKMVLFSLIIVSFGWLSSTLVGLMEGVRHPWMAYPDPFFLLAFIAIITGAVVCARLTVTLQITRDPYRLFRSAFIILLLLMAVMFFFGTIKLAIAPAFALLFISLAMIVGQPVLRILFLAISPFWMIRLVFSEWKELVLRALALNLPANLPTTLIFNGIMIASFTLYILPFLFAAAAVLRTMPSLQKNLRFVKSDWAVACALLFFVSIAYTFTGIHSYNALWYRNINATITSNMTAQETSFDITSSEYLRDISVTIDGTTQRLKGTMSTKKQMPIPSTFDTALVHIQRTEQRTQHGDTTDIDIQMEIKTKQRAYEISVGYPRLPTKNYPIMYSPLLITSSDNEELIRFYSFPDTAITVPIQLQLIGQDTIKETVKIVFSELPPSVNIEGDLCYVIPRMEFVQEWKYYK